ncbi:MAG TPA: hypothetical protein VHK69_22890 [Chitinophagaceae bacterium]|nr:hypothetical protein [Chitinophagaceae bacterium]
MTAGVRRKEGRCLHAFKTCLPRPFLYTRQIAFFKLRAAVIKATVTPRVVSNSTTEGPAPAPTTLPKPLFFLSTPPTTQCGWPTAVPGSSFLMHQRLYPFIFKITNMKKSVLLAAVCLLTVAATTARSQAENPFPEKKQSAEYAAAGMKSGGFASTRPPEISERVARRFEKSFPGITNTAWEATENGYVVRFISEGIQNWAYLNKKGACLSTMRYFTPEQLPARMHSHIKAAFDRFRITSAKEICHNQTTAYLVSIDDGSTWKVVHILDGEMTVTATYVRPK